MLEPIIVRSDYQMEPTKEVALTLKQRIHAGEELLGINVNTGFTRTKLEDTIASGPYDFLVIDSQHTAFNEESVTAFCELAAEVGIHVQFRIKHTRHTYLIGNYLDLGPSGVEVPQVELASTVDEGIDNFYYIPDGVRSWGGRTRLGLETRGDDHVGYRKWWNETGVLWMQIESLAAVSNAHLLAKPGVDCLSFGPMDMTLDIEIHPNHPLQTVDDCLQHTMKQLEDSDTKIVFRNNTPDTRQKYRDMGVQILLELAR